MSSHDPFGGDGDRTIITPQGTDRAPPVVPGRAQSTNVLSNEEVAIGAGTSNPMLGAAAPLFALVSQLKSSVSHSDPMRLQTHVAQEIANFESSAKQAGEAAASVLAARYAICTLLDEVALSTPWGVESNWASETLLVKFHNEAGGGQKFFQILERLMQDPARNLHLLEFYYVCLALGFEGQFRLQPRGLADLEQTRLSVYETIRQFKGNIERSLSPRWQGVEFNRTRLANYIPLWVLGLIGVGICLATYVSFLVLLNLDSNPIAGKIDGLARDSVPIETRQLVPVMQETTLRDVLQRDETVRAAMAANLLQVEEGPNNSKIRLWELFPSGQSSVSSGRELLVERVALGLAQFEGRVQIVGHTDNEPIRSIRFPSNWVLSKRRAESVGLLVAAKISPTRLSSEGRADTEPVDSNENAAGRARNRRIDIELFYEGVEL